MKRFEKELGIGIKMKAVEQVESEHKPESAKTCTFKRGDRVIVSKPKVLPEDHPVWLDNMTDTATVIDIFSDGIGIELDTNLSENTIERVVVRKEWCSLIEGEKKEAKAEENAIISPKKMRIYIAGKITGMCHGDVNRTFGNAKDLVEQWGFEAVSPLDHGDESKSWAENMLILLPILNTCDGIYLLDNWESSDGARIEKKFAEKNGMFLIKEVV